MKPKQIVIIIGMLSILLSGCVVNQPPDMYIQNYTGIEVISMNLNFVMTTTFCQENGYSRAEQWIIGEEHSGMYGQKVGYDIWGGDGHFNANDLRVHVDCVGTSTQEQSHAIEEVDTWIHSLHLRHTHPHNNLTYEYFCQQEGKNYKNNSGDIVTCSRQEGISKEFTPQEIARWYIERGDQ